MTTMDSELLTALIAREQAAADLQAAAHALTRSIAAFNSASAAALAAIPVIAVALGERAKVRETARLSGEPSSSDAEDNQRMHRARGAGLGAAGAAELKLTQAYSNGFRNGTPAETLGLELSTEAATFLRAAADVGFHRAPETQPDGRFLSIITCQHASLRDLAKQFT